ncbi:MAG: APC family permease [Mycobacterium sp.]
MKRLNGQRRARFLAGGGFDAVAVSIGGMAPTVAMNLNPQQPAQHVGRAVPLIFALCTLLLLAVAWCFAHLARRYPGSGSSYTFVGATLGPRAGFVAGWITLGAYLSFVMVAIAGFGLFGSNILDRFPTAPHLSPDSLSLIAAGIIGLLCLTSLRATGRALMALEGISVLAMLALSAVVLKKVFEGHGPIGDPRIRMVFVPPDHIGIYAIALGLGFGFLSYAGFETSATLGKEIPQASRTIPRALIFTLLTLGLICTVISAAEVLGFGLTTADMARFTASTSLLGDLATTYAGHDVGDVFDVFAMLSAVGGGLAAAAAGSRILDTLVRHTAPHSALGRTEGNTGTPRKAALLILAVGALGYEAMRQVFGASASDAFFWASTLAALAILVAYLLVTLGAGRSVRRSTSGAERITLVIPVIAAVAIVYTLWVNVYPIQPGAYAVLPWVALGWFVIPVVAVVAIPRIAREISAGLATDSIPQEPACRPFG